ncbi:MAG TPA: VOC family protein [Candidatus Saccharimonadales bacterium]|nr:VOC family protein [Candidatus Saccharimonadales bacterium]
MPLAKKLSMFSITVKDMPKMTNFYADLLGLEVTQDYRQDEKNWWITLALPEGGVSITLGLAEESMRPDSLAIYFATADAKKAYDELKEKGADVSTVQDDLYGPGSGVKFVTLADPEGNRVLLVEE